MLKRASFSTISSTVSAWPSHNIPTLGSKKERKSKETKAIRIEIKLAEPTKETYSEYSYIDLVRLAAGESLSNDFLDPFDSEFDDENLKRLARKYNEKYGPRKKRYGVMEDYIDKGAGYDDTDPFINNDEAYDELVPSTLTTKHGGFYINTGKLDFKPIGEIEDNDEDDDVDDDMEEIKSEVSRVKKRQHVDTNKPPKKRKVSSLLSKKDSTKGEEGKSTDKSLSASHIVNNEKRTQEVKDNPNLCENQQSPDESSDDESIDEDSPCKDEKRFLASIDSTIESVIKESDRLIDKGGSSSMIRDSANELACKTSSSPDYDDSQNPIESIPKLPDNLPTKLNDLLKLLKEARLGNAAGKKSFFTDQVNKMLLDVERRCRELPRNTRNQVYANLSSYLPCNKDTLMRRVKKLYKEAEEKKNKSLNKPRIITTNSLSTNNSLNNNTSCISTTTTVTTITTTTTNNNHQSNNDNNNDNNNNNNSTNLENQNTHNFGNQSKVSSSNLNNTSASSASASYVISKQNNSNPLNALNSARSSINHSKANAISSLSATTNLNSTSKLSSLSNSSNLATANISNQFKPHPSSTITIHTASNRSIINKSKPILNTPRTSHSTSSKTPSVTISPSSSLASISNTSSISGIHRSSCVVSCSKLSTITSTSKITTTASNSLKQQTSSYKISPIMSHSTSIAADSQAQSVNIQKNIQSSAIKPLNSLSKALSTSKAISHHTKSSQISANQINSCNKTLNVDNKSLTLSSNQNFALNKPTVNQNKNIVNISKNQLSSSASGSKSATSLPSISIRNMSVGSVSMANVSLSSVNTPNHSRSQTNTSLSTTHQTIKQTANTTVFNQSNHQSHNLYTNNDDNWMFRTYQQQHSKQQQSPQQLIQQLNAYNHYQQTNIHHQPHHLLCGCQECKAIPRYQSNF